jgi:plasmid maintenance system antidote protein VapI
MAKKIPPMHPGEILREEFLGPLQLMPYAVAAALNVRVPGSNASCAKKARCPQLWDDDVSVSPAS